MIEADAMHELSIAVSIVDAVCEELQRRGDPKLHAVHLTMGALSGIVKESLLFAYDAACEGTPLAGTRLVIDETPGEEFLVTALEIEA
jgi:hydrogenase nickel incorporation protein HypA/HybF